MRTIRERPGGTCRRVCLSVRAVATFTLACSLLFVAATLLFLPNRWPIILSLPVLAFLLGYSYAKRFTSWCHYWLSAALMLSPIAAWIAITGTVTWTPVLIAGAVFFWVGGFDVLYACQDVDFDRTRSLNSIPARWGVERALQIARAESRRHRRLSVRPVARRRPGPDVSRRSTFS